MLITWKFFWLKVKLVCRHLPFIVVENVTECIDLLFIRIAVYWFHDEFKYQKFLRCSDTSKLVFVSCRQMMSACFDLNKLNILSLFVFWFIPLQFRDINEKGGSIWLFMKLDSWRVFFFLFVSFFCFSSILFFSDYLPFRSWRWIICSFAKILTRKRWRNIWQCVFW